MKQLSATLSGLTPIVTYIFIYYALNDLSDTDVDGAGSLILFYALLFAVAAALTRDTAKILRQVGSRNGQYAHCSVAVSVGLLASAFFIEGFTFMLFGLALLLASQAVWFWTVFKKTS